MTSTILKRFTGNNEVLTAFAVGCFEEDVLSQYAMGEKNWWRCEIEVTGNLLKRTRNNYPGAGAIINEAIKNMLKVDDQGYLSVCVGIYNFLYWNSHDSVCVVRTLYRRKAGLAKRYIAQKYKTLK